MPYKTILVSSLVSSPVSSLVSSLVLSLVSGLVSGRVSCLIPYLVRNLVCVFWACCLCMSGHIYRLNLSSFRRPRLDPICYLPP
jgi:hypothetical protein